MVKIQRTGKPLKSVAALIVVLSFAIGPFSHASTLLLEDHFNHKNLLTWAWISWGKSAYHVDQGLSLLVTPEANDQTYSNAEVMSWQGFAGMTLEVVANSQSLDQGSRGWGYWNQSLDPKNSEIAFFIYLRGASDYPLNGFFIMTQKMGHAPDFYKLDEGLLSTPHTYSIKWTGDMLSYGIDGVEVHQMNINVPTGRMNIHLWSDNAVYDLKTYNMILQKVGKSTPVAIQSVRVTDPH